MLRNVQKGGLRRFVRGVFHNEELEYAEVLATKGQMRAYDCNEYWKTSNVAISGKTKKKSSACLLLS